MEKNQPNYYAIIPINILCNNSLMSQSAKIYGLISSLCNEKGYCWATNQYFADKFNVSETSISKWIADLKDHKYITIVYRKRGFEITERFIYLANIVSDEEKLNGPDEDLFSGSDEEKLKENIKENNKDNTLPYAEKATGKNIPFEFNDCRKYFYKLYIKNLHRKPRWGAAEANLLKADLKKFDGVPGLMQSPGTILKLAMEVWIYNESDNPWLIDRARKSGYTYNAFHVHLDAILEYMRRVAEDR